ncbi:MAG: orotidine 5'-phosphate decarboxylase, partial [Propionibacteriaceae bacterium]|nr:orotidine 5'-phosphate decarboxylase [Propionibacteriaceae bacterium]
MTRENISAVGGESATPYLERLAQRVETLGPLCVGIDPHGAVLDAWGVSHDVQGLEAMARGVVEALVATVAVFKP